MQSISLNGTWKLFFRPQVEDSIKSSEELKKQNINCIPAIVPGNVELDLSKSGILPQDLFMGMNITQAEQYECYEWWYVKSFSPVKCDITHRAILSFGAVDCIAEYYLNGELLGESKNMFIENRFDVTDKLKYQEKNELLVHIKSPIATLKDKITDLNILMYSWHPTFLAAHLRKAQHSYGWDIMPRAVSAGIWRDVTLYYEPIYKFNYIHFETLKVDNGNANINMYYDVSVPNVKLFSQIICRIEGRCDESEFCVENKGLLCGAGKVSFEIPNAKLWWPKNYGEPNLYNIKVTLLDSQGNMLLSKELRQGFRKLSLERSTEVKKDGKFNFIINDIKIFAVGSNWVPMDAYHSRDKERYARALGLANDIGCNILRCWGGNVYEDKEFFEYCDEHGIMVWQDFGMACKYYPQTDEFFKEIKEEAEQVVLKLRDYACLVVWSGDNEIDEMISCAYDELNSQNIKPSKNKITREILPDILERLDPLRPYIESSPYISDDILGFENIQSRPECHLWGPRDYFKSEYYKDSKAYFVSETGYHGAPSEASLVKFITSENLWPYDVSNEEWNLHSSDQVNSPDRILLMFNQIKQLFGIVPETLNEFVLASQISQAEAFKFFIERVRCKMNYMGGIIWWNLIDGWPQLSDAVVDYYYEKKLAYSFIKRSSRYLTIMMSEINPNSRSIICANSTLKSIKGTCKVIDIETNSVVFEGLFDAAPNNNTEIGKIPAYYSEKGMYLICWEIGGMKYVNTYLYGTPCFDLKSYKKWIDIVQETELKYTEDNEKYLNE